jgi:DNA mismatch repair protein MSH2
MAWRFMKRGGGKVMNGTAGRNAAASITVNSMNATGDVSVASEATSEELFIGWFDQQWPHQSVNISTPISPTPAARSPGTGVSHTASASTSMSLKIFEQRRGEYFCCFGSDALSVADSFFRTRDVVRFIPIPNNGRIATEQRALPRLNISPRKLLTILQTIVLGRGESIDLWRKDNSKPLDEDGEQEEDDGIDMDEGSTRNRPSMGTSWYCARRITPGNLDGLEELLGFTLSSSFANSCVAIRLIHNTDGVAGSRILALAFVDTQARTARMLEMQVDDASLAALEHALLAEGASQAFLLIPSHLTPHAADDWRQIKSILADCKIPIQHATHTRKSAVGGAAAGSTVDDSSVNDELRILSSGTGGAPLTLNDLQELSRFMASSSPLSLQAPGLLQTKRHALIALQFLIRAIGITASDDESARLRLDELRLDEFCRLDQAAFQALTLFPRAGDDAIDRNMTLFGVLNKTRTPMGSRILANFIRQPLTNRDRIVKRQDCVEMFVNNTELRTAVRDQHLRGTPDLPRLSIRFQKRKGTLADVMEVYRLACIRLPQLRDALVEFAAGQSSASPSDAVSLSERLHTDFITPISTHLSSLQPFINMVEQAVLVEESTSHDHVRMHYLINPAIHSALAEIAAARTQARAALDTEVASLQEAINEASNGSVQPKLAYSDTNNSGYHLRLTKTEQRKWNGGTDIMPGGSQAVKVLENRRDGLHFTSRRLEKLSHTLQAVTEEYNTASAQLLTDVIATTATYTPVLDASASLLALLDAFSTLAHVAVTAGVPWIRPSILPMGSQLIDLKAGRHACMEMVATSCNGSYIPANAHLERNVSHLQIITGPNCGGKSSYCRMVGLNILMAQMGSFIPASSATITVVDSILCRVGAGDSTTRAQSTFLVEMIESSTILRQATPSSFVIVDELGRGTSIDEGFGIAYAIAEYLAKEIRCFCFFATHFHEITELANQLDGSVHIPLNHCDLFTSMRSLSLYVHVCACALFSVL